MIDAVAENTGPRIGIVAAEASGDLLGAGLIEAIRAEYPNASFFGVAGPKMRATGCTAWHDTEDISVMGLAEVLPHLLRLLRLRHNLGVEFTAAQPDVFVGIDSPDFNLPIARVLKGSGIPTVQYVSPQVWAWRQSRVNDIRDAYDQILCLLPFETDFYRDHGMPATFVGHPMADEIPDTSNPGPAREALGLVGDGPVLALLPGSRRSEVARLARPFLETAEWLGRRIEGLRTVVAIANERVAGEVEAAVAAVRPGERPQMVIGRAREVLAAADVVLTASGTAALETMLVKRPMVVAYRMSSVSYAIVRRMGIARLPFYSLPNLLAGREVAREFVQRSVRADVLGPALEECLAGQGPAPDWREQFAAIHQRLRGGGSRAAASVVLDLSGHPSGPQ